VGFESLQCETNKMLIRLISNGLLLIAGHVGLCMMCIFPISVQRQFLTNELIKVGGYHIWCIKLHKVLVVIHESKSLLLQRA
jgi:hypothetical protein